MCSNETKDHPVTWSSANFAALNNEQVDLVDDQYIILLDFKYTCSPTPASDLTINWRQLLDVIFKVPLISHDAGLSEILSYLASTIPYSADVKAYFKNSISISCTLIESILKCASLEVQTARRIVSGYKCLLEWCSNYKDLCNDRESVLRCLSVVRLGTEVPLGNSVKDDGEKLCVTINKWSQQLFKRLSGHTTQNSEFSERDIVEYWQSKYSGEEPVLQYLLVNHVNILCLVNPPPSMYATSVTPSDDVTPLLYRVVRDPCSGPAVHWLKYEMEELTKPFLRREKVPRPAGVKQAGTFGNVQTEECEKSNCVTGDCETFTRQLLGEDICTFSGLQEKMKENNFRQYLTGSCLLKGSQVSSPDKQPPDDLQSPECCKYPDSPRLFLAHSAILSPKMFAEQRPHPEDSDSQKVEETSPSVILLENSTLLQNKLRELDKVSSKDCQTVVVLYMRPGQRNFTDVLQNNRIMQSDSDFCTFLSNLGSKIVDVFTYVGWNGLQLPKNLAKEQYTFPYYSNASNELIFLIPSLILTKIDTKNKSDATTRDFHRDDFLESIRWDMTNSDLPRVVIVWSNSLKDALCISFNDLAASLKCAQHSQFIVIFLTPLPNDFVKTTVRWTGPSQFIAPDLLQRCSKVVHKRVTPVLVRETCLAVRSAALAERLDLLPQNLRECYIGEIKRQCGSIDYENGYFNCFFSQHRHFKA